MSLIGNLQTFTAGASGIIGVDAKAQFKRGMDIVMVDLGRDITVHLEESRSQCSDPNCSYDAFYKRYVSTNGQVCQTCRGQGFFLEHRYTVYRANIRWTNEPFNNSRTIEEADSIGRIGVNFCRTKTVESSFDHIRSSNGATIDGENVELVRPPRKIAFGDVIYTVAWWKIVNH